MGCSLFIPGESLCESVSRGIELDFSYEGWFWPKLALSCHGHIENQTFTTTTKGGCGVHNSFWTGPREKLGWLTLLNVTKYRTKSDFSYQHSPCEPHNS